jgi:hypothetical protein
LFFTRGDGDGEYRPGHHAGGGADLRMIAQPANLSSNAWLAVFAEITDDLSDYLHSALASREAMSAGARKLAGEIVRKFPALKRPQRYYPANQSDTPGFVRRK